MMFLLEEGEEEGREEEEDIEAKYEDEDEKL